MEVIMQYDRFKQIFNETIFEKSKADLLEKIANNPSRYIGLFRPTKPKSKILQNLLQSHEIRFGNAFEQVMEEYLKLKSCIILPKKYTRDNNETLDIDQCFEINDKIYFIEQKVRDDHDSTKKRGQIDNFEKKLDLLQSKYGEKELVGIFYFIDPSLVKNRNFYFQEIQNITNDYGVETQIFYGKSLFDYLNIPDVWEEILEYLKWWRSELPELPEINFDLDSQQTFNEIKDIRPIYFRKLFENEELFNDIVQILFPERETLKLLFEYFNGKQEAIYKKLAVKLSCYK